MAFQGLILKVNYRLNRLRLWGQPMNRWLFLLALLGVIAVAVDLVESGPVADAVVIPACLGLMLALLWAGRARYLIFRKAFEGENVRWPTLSCVDFAFCVRKDLVESLP